MYRIERSRWEDLAHLPAIEERAGELFRHFPATAHLPLYTSSVEDFEGAHGRDLLWVARSDPGGPVGFALVEMLGGVPHLEEVDVLPEHGRRGLGKALVERVCDWGRDSGFETLTLCTFRDVPWNAPFYGRLGFRMLQRGERTAALDERLDEEARHGLPRDLRVAMARRLRDERPPPIR
ncbi:MAG: GNAT family N-acetyltransferase [Acidobacteriota bacterium]